MMAEPLWMELTNMDVSSNLKLDGNNMAIMAGIRSKGCIMEGMNGLGAGGRRPSSSSVASLSSSSLSSMLLSSAPINRETASSFGSQRRKAMREDLERKETERKELEKKEMERKETERKDLEMKEGRVDLEALVWITDMLKRMDRNEETEKKEMERKGLENRELERKEPERKETDRKEIDRKGMGRKEVSREKASSYRIKWRKAMKVEIVRKMDMFERMDRNKMKREEMEKKEIERKEMERKELERKEMERKELERKETERKAMERKEMERKEMDRKETERKEILSSRKSISPPSSVAVRVRDMFVALGNGRKGEMTKGSNEGKMAGSNGKGRMDRMGEEDGKDEKEKEKEIEKEILEVMDREGKKKEGEGSSVGKKRSRKCGKKGIGREETLEVLRGRNTELVAQLRKVMEENALLHERIWRMSPRKSSSPHMRKVVKELVMDVAHEDVDGPVALPREEELPLLLPPLPPCVGGMQDGSKDKEVETLMASELKVADWRVVAHRNWRRGRVEDVLSPPPPPGPIRKRELLVVGLEGSVAPRKIMEALCGIGSCPKEDIRIGPMRTRSGTGTVWAQLPVAAAFKAAKEGRMRVGRTTAGVELLRVRPLQCFKCWSFGHAQNACRSVANRWKACYRCGQEGHMARDCVNPAHCVVCFDAGMDAHHRLGGSLCAALRRQGTVIKGRIGGQKEGRIEGL